MVCSAPGNPLRQSRQDCPGLSSGAPAERAPELQLRWSSLRNPFCDPRRAIFARTRAAPLARAPALSPPRTLALPMHLSGILCSQKLATYLKCCAAAFFTQRSQRLFAEDAKLRARLSVPRRKPPRPLRGRIHRGNAATGVRSNEVFSS
jgi:hypothetical protein